MSTPLATTEAEFMEEPKLIPEEPPSPPATDVIVQPSSSTERRLTPASQARLERKITIAITSAFASWVYFGNVLLNAALIGIGHSFLIIIFLFPMPRRLLPSSADPYMFVRTDMWGTYKAAAVGSFIVCLPLFFVVNRILRKVFGKKQDDAAAGSRPPNQFQANRAWWARLPPRVRALLWEVWMISAAPVGSLYMKQVVKVDGEVLSPLHATIAAIIGRLLYFVCKCIQLAFKNKEEAKEDAQLEAELEALRMEEGSVPREGALRLESDD